MRVCRSLLRRHVVGSPERQPRLRHPPARGRAHGECYPEIGDDHATVAQEDVLGLDVPVNHSLLVRVLQRIGHLGGNLHRLVDAELQLAIELVPQSLPLYVRHGVVQELRTALCRGAAAVVHRQNVRVLEPRHRLDFLDEPLGAEHSRQLGPQHLQRDLPVVLQVLRQVDGGHAAFTKAAFDTVPIGERSGEAPRDVSHELRRSVEQTRCQFVRRPPSESAREVG